MKYEEISKVSYAGKPVSYSAMYVTKKVEHLLENLKNVNNCLIFCEKNIVIPRDLGNFNHKFVYTDNPQYEYAKFANNLYNVINKKNKLRTYQLKDGYYIGENVQIGLNTIIEPNVFIDHDCFIGNNTLIKSGAIIRKAEIRNNCTIHEKAVIGSDAFTIGKDIDFNNLKLPTFGRVVIGTGVEIGPFTSISASSTDKTIIDDYAKIDSHCYIAHDVHVGKNVIIASGSTIGGFTLIGDNTYISMNTTIRNRLKLAKKTYLGMGAVLVKNNLEENVLVGNPAKVLRKKV